MSRAKRMIGTFLMIMVFTGTQLLIIGNAATSAEANVQVTTNQKYEGLDDWNSHIDLCPEYKLKCNQTLCSNVKK